MKIAALIALASFHSVSAFAAPPTPVCGTTSLTLSTTQAITALNSVSCNGGGGLLHEDNAYYRVFPSSMLPTGFSACGVQIGIEEASSGGATQPVTVRIYSSAPGAFPASPGTLIGTTNEAVSPQSFTVLPVPVTATVPAGNDLVVEVFTPNGVAANNRFFIGSNSDGESGPGYLRAPTCGLTNPETLSSVGFPNMHLVLNLDGTPFTVPTVTAISPNNGPASGGQLVTITGTGFTGATAVNIGGTACTGFTVASDTSITCTTGAHAAGPNSVEVTNPAGTNAANALYTYAAVVVGAASIPTLSTWGTLILIALMGWGMVWSMRRR